MPLCPPSTHPGPTAPTDGARGALGVQWGTRRGPKALRRAVSTPRRRGAGLLRAEKRRGEGVTDLKLTCQTPHQYYDNSPVRFSDPACCLTASAALGGTAGCLPAALGCGHPLTPQHPAQRPPRAPRVPSSSGCSMLGHRSVLSHPQSGEAAAPGRALGGYEGCLAEGWSCRRVLSTAQQPCILQSHPPWLG